MADGHAHVRLLALGTAISWEGWQVHGSLGIFCRTRLGDEFDFAHSNFDSNRSVLDLGALPCRWVDAPRPVALNSIKGPNYEGAQITSSADTSLVVNLEDDPVSVHEWLESEESGDRGKEGRPLRYLSLE